MKYTYNRDRIFNYHTWFAWYPVVVVDDDGGHRVWLQTVARKLVSNMHVPPTWQYKFVKKQQCN